MPALRSAGYTTTVKSLAEHRSCESKADLTVEKRKDSEREDSREVLHQVVWCRTKVHRTSLRDQIVENLGPAEREEREQQKVLRAVLVRRTANRSGHVIPCKLADHF
jgi:putative protein kinase ArgK-like GTPase of G3E family